MSQSTSSSDTKPKLAKLRKYDDIYFKFGFTEKSDGGPKFVMYLKVLVNEAMKPAKLKQHLIAKHPEYEGKTKYFFWKESKEYTQQKTCLFRQLCREMDAGYDAQQYHTEV